MPGRRGGPPARISREGIERAVIEVGFDSATTTSVARHLGVDQSSLYRHIGSREAMMVGAIDRVLAAQDWESDASDWRAYLRAHARTIWNVLREHRGLAGQLSSLGIVPPTSATVLVRSVAVLRHHGWSLADAVLVLDTISDMTGDAVAMVERAEASRDRDHIDNPAIFASADPDNAALAAEIAGYLANALSNDPRAWWERKLDVILAGAAHVAENHRPRSSTPRGSSRPVVDSPTNEVATRDQPDDHDLPRK